MIKDKKIIRYLVPCLVLLGVPLQGQSPATKQQSTILFSHTDTTTENRIQHGALYLKANYFHHSEKYGQALQTYQRLFTLDPSSYVYDGFLRLLSDTNQFSAIVKLIDKTQELFKDDLDIQLIYAQSFLNTDNNKQAEILLQTLQKKHPNNEQVMFYTTTHNEKTNNLDKALVDIDVYLKSNPTRRKNFLFHFFKAKILLKKEDTKGALEAVNTSLKLFNRFDKAVLFKALLLQEMGQMNDAIESYKKFIEMADFNPAVLKQLVHLLFSQERFSEAATYLKKIEQHGPQKSLPAEFFFDLALLKWKGKDATAALIQAKKALGIKPDLIQAQLLTIDILFSIKKYKTVLENAQSWLNKKPTNNIVLHKLFTLINTEPTKEQTITPQALLTMLETIHKKHSQRSNISLAMGDLSLQTKQYDKAITHYEAVAKKSNDQELQAKITFQKAFITITRNKTPRTKDIEQALEMLEQGKKNNVIYLSSIHLEGYCQMLLGKYDKAHTALDKVLNDAITLPDNYKACVLDTKSQIHQRQKQYGEQIKILEHATKLAPNDRRIQQHLTQAKTNHGHITA